MGVLWTAQDSSQPCTSFSAPFPSGTHAVWCGNPSTCDFDGTGGVFGPVGMLTLLQPIALPSTTGVIELKFSTLSQAEDWENLDPRYAEVSTDGGASWASVVECNTA